FRSGLEEEPLQLRQLGEPGEGGRLEVVYRGAGHFVPGRERGGRDDRGARARPGRCAIRGQIAVSVGRRDREAGHRQQDGGPRQRRDREQALAAAPGEGERGTAEEEGDVAPELRGDINQRGV